MSDNKNNADKNDDLELDLDSLSFSIDREIDKLLVPTGSSDGQDLPPPESSEVVLEVTELEQAPVPSPPPPPRRSQAAFQGGRRRLRRECIRRTHRP